MAKILELQLQHQSFQWIFSWFPLGSTGLISLLSKGYSRVFSAPQFESINSLTLSLLYELQLEYMTNRKTITLIGCTFVCKVISLLFNMLPKFVIAFLPRSKHLLISWLQSPSMVILVPMKIKSVTVSTICHEMMGPDAIILVRESIPREVDKNSRGPQGERGLEFSRWKKGQIFFPSTFLRII